MNLPAPGGFLLPKEGGYDGTFFKPNAFFYFEDIQLDEGEQEGATVSHFQFSGDPNIFFDSFSLFPRIHFVDCPSLAVNLGGAPSSVFTNHCGVNFFTTGRSQPLQGEIAFVDCRFIPVQGADGSIPYILQAALGTIFTNCTFHLASGNPYVYSDRESSVGFIKINESVSYNHIHSRLGKDVIRFLKKEGIAIKPDFIQMLKSHHELEDDS